MEWLKKSVAKKWVKALRSDKYTQCYNGLSEEDGSVCALGVLCDISKLGRWKKNLEYTNYKKVLKWAGLTEDGVDTIVDWNDYEQKTFPTIANLIEQDLSKRIK